LQKQVADGNTTYYYYDANGMDLLERELTADANTFYYYDDNGSLVEEAKDTGTLRTYAYNYLNRLSDVNDGTTVVSYTYNPGGIRVKAAVSSGSTTEYLIDPYNHTGYAQVLKAEVDNDANTVYILGHDVLGQAVGTSDPNYFVYDGHGSVRHLVDNAGALIAGQVPNVGAAPVTENSYGN